MELLPPGQARIFAAILNLIRRHGYPPTICELMQKTRIKNPNGIACHLKRLRKKGWIEWEKGNARTIRPLFKFLPANKLGVSR